MTGFNYTSPLRWGAVDYFRLPIVTGLTTAVTVAAVTDLTSPLYKLDAVDGYSRTVTPALAPSSSDAVWLGGISEEGDEVDPQAELSPVLRGNSKTIHDYTLSDAQPLIKAQLLYNGCGDLENALGFLPGGSSSPYLYEGLQSDAGNQVEPNFALLKILYSDYNPLYAWLVLYFRGVFKYPKRKHNKDHQVIDMEFLTLPGVDSMGVPFGVNKALSRRWRVALAVPGTPLTWQL